MDKQSKNMRKQAMTSEQKSIHNAVKKITALQLMQIQNSYFDLCNQGNEICKLLCLPDMRNYSDIFNPALIRALQGFKGVGGYLIPSKHPMITNYNFVIGSKLEYISFGHHMKKVIKITDNTIRFEIDEDDIKDLPTSLLLGLTPNKVEELIEIAPGLSPLRSLFKPIVEEERFITLKDIAMGLIEYEDVRKSTPQGEQQYTQGNYKEASIIAMCELVNLNKDKIDKVKQALEV